VINVTSPGLILGGGASSDSAGQNSRPGTLEQAYQNLLSGAADIVSGLGVKTLVLDSGAIGSAGSIQTNNTETAAEVAANMAILGSIAAYCKANGIVVQVDASLIGGAPLVNQWATAAAVVGLPIVSVEDVNEVGFQASLTPNFATYATNEVAGIKALVSDYSSSSYTLNASNLAVGDMEGGGATDMTTISQWWSAYNTAVIANNSTATASAKLNPFSYVTADTGWFAPWTDPLRIPTWQGYLEALSALTVSDGMALNVVVQGAEVDTSASQNMAQSEQNAIDLAMLQASGSVAVSNILVRTWQQLPIGVGEISSPTSSSNQAAELDAVYPLFLNRSITGQGPQGSFTVTAPGQVVLNTGTTKSIGSLSVQWSAADIQAGNRLGVVIIDQTGTLKATVHGSGTESNEASNILILTGNSVDLAAELSSITLNEPNAGPDTIDIETFGTAGQLSDNQISVLAAATGQALGSINATSNLQGWVSSSAFLNNGTVITGGSVLTSETLGWNTTGTLAGTIAGTSPGQSAFVKIDTIHEPLAEYGVASVTGSALAADYITQNGTTGGTLGLSPTATVVADVNMPSFDDGAFGSGGYANNPGANNVPLNAVRGSLPGWLPNAFDPQTELTSLIVQSTTNTFSPSTGQLQTSVDSLVPDPLTVLYSNGQGTVTYSGADTFATAFNTGGSQVTQYNTGNNPSWQVGWGNQFSSATLTYDAAGQVVETFLQGGPSDPWFTIDDVFNPNTGQLWEEFNSVAPPPIGSGTTNYAGTTSDPYQPGFDTGPLYVTEFNTGNNPNWDYVDWGSAVASDTEVWVGNFIVDNFPGFADYLPTVVPGDVNYYPYEFVNGSTLDLLDLPGTINVNLNALGTVEIASQVLSTGLSGLNAVDAGGATGTVTLTGLTAGGSTLIGGGSSSTICVSGAGNNVSLANGGTIVETGSNASTTATGSGVTASLNSSGDTINLIGNNGTVTAVAGDTIGFTGTAETLVASGVTFNTGNNTTNVTVNGSNNVLGAAAGSTVEFVGSSAGEDVYGNSIAIVAISSAAVIQAFGNSDRINAVSGDSIGIYGTSNVVSASGITLSTAYSTSTVTLSGTNNVVGAANGSTVDFGSGSESATVFGSSMTIVATSSTTNLQIHGGGDTITGVSGDTIGLNDTAETVTGGAGIAVNLYNNAGATINGSGGTFGIFGTNIAVAVSGEMGSTSASTSFSLYGSNDTITLGNNATAWLDGGTNNVVNNDFGGDAVNLTSNATATINGLYGFFGIYGTNIIVAASGESASTIANASFALYGSNDTINLGANTAASLIGGTNNVVNNDVAGASVNLTSNATATINGSGGYFGICGTSITVTASGENVSTINNATFNLAGNNNSINLGANSYVGLLGGSGSTVNGGGDTIASLANTSFNVNLEGGSDTVTIGTGSDFGIVGSSGNIGFITGGTDSFSIAATPGAQSVAGFNMQYGDQLDLRQILAGASLAHDLSNLSSFVSVSYSGSNTTLGVSGPGGSDTVLLSGIGAPSLQGMINNNMFVLPPH
jgi:hypothetical protein